MLVVKWLLKYRVANLILILGVTLFMAYKAMDVELSYELARMLPSTAKESREYDSFRKKFGEDGNTFIAGIKNDSMFRLAYFNGWYDAAEKIRNLDGIEEIVTITRTININGDDSLKKFNVYRIVKEKPKTQEELDSLKDEILKLPFYKNLLYNPDSNVYLMIVTLDKKKINDKSRGDLQKEIQSIVDNYSEKFNVETHYSGLPYIRTVITEKLQQELKLFIVLSLIIAAIILVIFFNSLNAVITSILVVIISIVWALGTMSLLGYKITILTAVLPSLLIMIAIENCIYVLNKYHQEYKYHGNQTRALCRVIQRIGFATLMTNLTTATGFATFIFTSNTILKEFGIVASLNVMVEFMLTLTLIPILLSFSKPPKEKHTRHLDNKFIRNILARLIYVIVYKRKYTYIVGISLVLICLFGVTKMHTSGKVLDDLPTTDKVYKDLKFLENNFGGVLPFEISIDSKKPNGVLTPGTIYNINKLQRELKQMPEFSKPLSLAELVKFSKQAYKGGEQKYYSLPDGRELLEMKDFVNNSVKGKENLLKSFIDSTRQYTRVSVQVKDLGMKEMMGLQKKLRPKIDSIFSKDKYEVTMTGNSIVNAKGTEFLINNLIESVLIGVFLISVLMTFVFRSPRIILIAIIVNVIPLLITAAIMGFTGIPVKPSTLIVFSIALGISVDNAILFLSKYRYEIKLCGGDIKVAAINSLRESGYSMIYSSVVFVLGFGIFIISGFGGTQALGFLISITLFAAMFFNIILLPSLLLSIDKRIIKKK